MSTSARAIHDYRQDDQRSLGVRLRLKPQPHDDARRKRRWGSRQGPVPRGWVSASTRDPRWEIQAERAGGDGSACTWHPLRATWEEAEEDVLSKGTLTGRLGPAWRVLLLSDGSVTRHLQLWTGSPPTVDCLEMRELGESDSGLPVGARDIGTRLLQRQVFLRSADGRPLVYATSWWDAASVGDYLQQTKEPIWANLAARRTELYRKVERVYLGESAHLAEAFGYAGPFWGRHYVFWHNGRPLTLIYEVFSPALETWLGT